MIGGFILNGNASKKVIIRAIGPSLSQSGITDFLADPLLELRDSVGSLILTNDNWRDVQETQIQSSGLAPQDDLESAIVATLQPGSYTAIVRGTDGVQGLGLVEVYDVQQGTDSKLVNISTRGRVQIGNKVMIGGFILGGSSENTKIMVRAIGPSLTQQGVSGALADPLLELRDATGTLIAQNDDWMTDEQAISSTGLAPSDSHESAIAQTLQPGNYTAIVRGKDNLTGVALVEVYTLQ